MGGLSRFQQSKNFRIIVGFGVLTAFIIFLSYFTLFKNLEFYGGNSSLEISNKIFWEIRVPKLAAAILCGMSLSVSGLALQTLFRNPLCGPFVLGISSGASLGVALSLLAGFSFGHFGVLSAASIGAFFVTTLVMFVAKSSKNATVLLIVGLLMGYFIDALVSLLIVNSNAESLRVYVSWGMGSFGRLTYNGIGIFAFVVAFGFLCILFCMRYLNSALWGEDFAKSLGVNVQKNRLILLFGTSILAAASTAFCGPVAFVGIAVPHLAFMLFKTSNHRVLLPGAALCGIAICLVAVQFSTIPLNAVLSLVGVPTVLWVILRGRK